MGALRWAESPQQVARRLRTYLQRVKGHKITLRLAVQMASDIVKWLPAGQDHSKAFEELAQSLMVRKNLVLDDLVIRERSNNIATMWEEYGR